MTNQRVSGACWDCGCPHAMLADGDGKPLRKVSRCDPCREKRRVREAKGQPHPFIGPEVPHG